MPIVGTLDIKYLAQSKYRKYGFSLLAVDGPGRGSYQPLSYKAEVK
jgi:hypothetical protein